MTTVQRDVFSYLLKSVNRDMTSYNSFLYPSSGMVECNDWDPAPVSRGGIFGFLDGCGAGHLARWENEPKWLILRVKTCNVISVDGGDMVKVPGGEVVFAGSRLDAIAHLSGVAPHTLKMPVIGACRAIEGKGLAVSGYYGTSIAGMYGVAQAGWHGQAITGPYGTSIVDSYGTAIAGYQGRVKAGIGGTLVLPYLLDGQTRLFTSYVGEGGVKPNVFYHINRKTNTMQQCEND